jgi:hypothetical protein
VPGIHAGPQLLRQQMGKNFRLFRLSFALHVGVDGRDKHGHDAPGNKNDMGSEL